MRQVKSLIVAAFTTSALALAGCATAQQPGVSEQDHQAHHPEGAAKPAAPATKTPQTAQAQGMGQGGMGMGMMGGQSQGMMDGGKGGQGMMEMCSMMSASKSPEEHKSMVQQRLKNMSPDQIRQMMSMMDKQMSMMQGDMQMMQDHLAKQPK